MHSVAKPTCREKAISEFYCLMMKVKPSQWDLHRQGALLKDATFWTEPQCFVSEEFIGRKAIMELYHVNIVGCQAGFLIAPSGSFFTHVKANLEPKIHSGVSKGPRSVTE